MKTVSQFSNTQALDAAIQAQKVRDYDHAHLLYSEVLRVEPNNSQALYLIGALYYDQNKFELARDVLERAQTLEPSGIPAQALLGVVLSKLNEHERALPFFLAVAKATPSSTDAHYNLGSLYKLMGRFSEAASAYEKALELSPQNDAASVSLAQCALVLNYPDAAIEILSRCVLRSPEYLPAYTELSRILEGRGNLDHAAAVLQSCLNKGSNDPEIIGHLARLKYALGHLSDAEDLLRRILAVDPDNHEIKGSLAATLIHLNKLDEAELFFRDAIIREPDSIVILVNYSNYLLERGKLEEALIYTRRAVALKPTSAEAWNSLGMTAQHLGNFEEALASYDKAISLRPNFANALTNKGQALLQLGRLKEGWNFYHHRFDQVINTPKRRDLAIAQWPGDTRSTGRLFLWTDQGLGDEIIYSSMIHSAALRVGRCAVECSWRLSALFKRSFPEVDVIARNLQSNADVQSFAPDFQLAMAELGRISRPDFLSFPEHSGYLRPDREVVEEIRKNYGKIAAGRAIIGISWKSDNPRTGHFKSTSLQHWLPILQTKDAIFVSLQYGEQDADINGINLVLDSGIHRDLSVDAKGDLDRFAAQVAAMDLVITTSNTTAHFAGALNTPVWTLIPEGSGLLWYWFLSRADSPWYPSMTLFRQSNPGQWADVLSAIKTQFDVWMNSR